jgi:2-iminobutanoate/2-iminopropanoate deaminase
MTDRRPAPVGPYTAVVRAGDWLAVSGQIGVRDGALVAGGTIEELRQAVANLVVLLQAERASLADVVKTTLYLRHLGDYALVNEAYVECFEGHRPARTTVGVAELPLGALVEIDAWAFVG